MIKEKLKNPLLFHPISKSYEILQERFLCYYYQYKYSSTFADVPVYLMFLGYPRSAHSMLGALIDAHPETCISHELNVLKHLHKGRTQNQIFSRIIGRNKWFTARKNVWTGYSYRVPGQWQGTFKTLKVIGDKRGGASTRWISAYPGILDQLHRVIQKDIRIIHNHRNPFDNIATRARGGNLHQKAVSHQKLMIEIDKHFENIDTIDQLIKSGKYNIINISHESVINNPAATLKQICDYTGLEPYPDYIEAAASIVRSSPHKSRYKIDWPQEAKDKVHEKIKQYDFLHGYEF